MDVTTPAQIGVTREQELLKDSVSVIYRETKQGALKAHFFLPKNFPPAGDAPKLPVVAFFHGGLWDRSMPTQFVPHCLHYASYGAVTVAFEYRVANKHQTGPQEALNDFREALLFVRTHAHEAGFEVDKLIVGASGSGGQLALLATTNQSVPKEEKPDGIILYSAIVDTVVSGIADQAFTSNREAKAASPILQLPQKHLPPILIFHGTEDRIVPFDRAHRFARLYSKKGNICQFSPFEGAEHSFFNYNVSHEHFEHTLNIADAFLNENALMAIPQPLS